MQRCEICNNEYDRAFMITTDDGEHMYDCFECAIEGLAPRCGHCNVRVIGHGIQSEHRVYCCAHCARAEGHDMAIDNVG